MAISSLINQAYHPIIDELHESVLAAPSQLLRVTVPVRYANGALSSTVISKDKVLAKNSYGYDAAYVNNLVATNSSLLCPFTQFNRATMRKLLIAVERINIHLKKLMNADIIPEVFPGACQLLGQRSFAHADVLENFRIAGETILIAAAQLTSNRAGTFSADQLLRLVLSDSPDDSSLMVKFALRLPPGVLGKFGPVVYISEPLAYGSGRVNFSPHFNQFLRTARQLYGSRKPLAWELGHGCPVAHRLPDHPRAGLQLYINAILHAYEFEPES